jgi:hypothetical protein
MTLIEVFDRLHGKHITRIDFKDGTHAQSREPLLVDLAQNDTLANAWIEASAQGLVLHFNSRDAAYNTRGESVPLNDIAAVQ